MQRIHLMKRRHEYPLDHMGKSDEEVYRVQHIWNCSFQEDYPIYPHEVENVVRRLATWYREFYCRYYTVVMLLDGEMIYHVEDERFHLKKNNILIIPIGAKYDFKTTQNPYYRKLSIFILGVNAASIMETFKLNRPKIITVTEINELVTKVHMIDDLIVKHNTEDFYRMSGLLMEFLGKLSGTQKNYKDDMMQLRIACSRLNSNFEHNINISNLAKELNIGHKALNRLFREKMQISPRGYRLVCRMEQACELLTNTRLSVKEISANLGYCNQFYFSNEFSKNVGVSPKEYRKVPFLYKPL